MIDIIRTNTLLMLSRRGYDTSTILEETGEYLRIPDVLVIFIENGKVSIKTMKNIMTLRKSEEELLVIIHSKTLTSDAKKLASGPNIETFEFDEMFFDLLDVIPLHEKVTEDVKEKTKLPILRKTDPACKYFGFAPGNIIKIREDDDTIQYRRVV